MRKGLSQTQVLAAAFAMVDAGGPDALTMRALAARLGVAPMALYNHFRDREAILDALAAMVFEKLAAQSPQGTDRKTRRPGWRPRLRQIMLAAQAFASEHPHLYRLAMTYPNKPAAGFHLASEALGLLREAGLSHAQALNSFHAFVLMMHGYPHWRDGFDLHGEAIASQCNHPEEQFAASVEWLLQAASAMAKQKAPAKRPSSRNRH
jgi:AcrR family transcriptional regulator